MGTLLKPCKDISRDVKVESELLWPCKDNNNDLMIKSIINFLPQFGRIVYHLVVQLSKEQSLTSTSTRVVSELQHTN